MTNKKRYGALWLGTRESFDIYYNAMERLQAGGIVHDARQEEKKESSGPESRLLEIVDGVAVITINGVLVNSDEWYVRFFGMTGYPEIEAALLDALTNESVSQILLSVNSPGGTVSGVTSAADAVEAANKIKPVTVYSDSQITSGAYWIAAPAKKRYVGATTMAGSIGVIYVHYEITKMLEEEGITARVFRGGQYKALGQMEEVLTDKASEIIQEHIDDTYRVFVDAIANYLQKSYAEVDGKLAQGREFIGQKAADVGLVDGVSSFNKVFESLAKAAQTTKQARGEGMGKRYTSMAAAMAAVGAGVPPVDGEGIKAQDGEGTTEVKAEGTQLQEAEVKAEVHSGEEVTPEVNTSEVKAETPATSEVTKVEAPDPLVAELRSQLKIANDSVVDLKVELKSAQNAHASLEASITPAKAILAEGVNAMSFALFGTKDEKLAESLSLSALVERHAAVATTFKSQYKIGGVAALETDESQEKDDGPRLTAYQKARLAAAKTK